VWQAAFVAQYGAGNELTLDLRLPRRPGMDFENADCASLLDGDLIVVPRLEDWSTIFRFVGITVHWQLVVSLRCIASRRHRSQGKNTDERESEHRKKYDRKADSKKDPQSYLSDDATRISLAKLSRIQLTRPELGLCQDFPSVAAEKSLL